MKRFIAKRKSTKRCNCCDKKIAPGEIYYRHRHVFKDTFEDDKIYAMNYYYFHRCNYEEARRKKRFDDFIKSGKCKHPKKDIMFGLIAGEDYAQEPKYNYCLICNKII